LQRRHKEKDNDNHSDQEKASGTRKIFVLNMREKGGPSVPLMAGLKPRPTLHRTLKKEERR